MKTILTILYLILASTNAKPVDEYSTLSLTNTGIDEDFRLDSIGLDNRECDNCHALYTSPIYRLAFHILIGKTLANRFVYPAIATCLIPCKYRNRTTYIGMGTGLK